MWTTNADSQLRTYAVLKRNIKNMQGFANAGAFNMSWQCASVSPSTDNALTMQYQCMGMLL